MEIQALLADKSRKPKEKTEALSQLVASGSIAIADLLAYARTAKDPQKATCIEALEFATRTDPSLATKEVLLFVTETLTARAPRVKWESAKVIGHIAAVFPNDLDDAVNHLLENTAHEGTVVRWSAAYALGQVLLHATTKHPDLAAALKNVCAQEEKDSIRKIYLAAFKKAGIRP